MVCGLALAACARDWLMINPQQTRDRAARRWKIFDIVLLRRGQKLAGMPAQPIVVRPVNTTRAATPEWRSGPRRKLRWLRGCLLVLAEQRRGQQDRRDRGDDLQNVPDPV